MPGDAEIADLARFERGDDRPARLVIGDAALLLGSGPRATPVRATTRRRRIAHVYDLGAEWKRWTGLPFVFAVWVAQRTTPVADALARARGADRESRDWGLQHLDELAAAGRTARRASRRGVRRVLPGLDYGLSYPHLAGLTSSSASSSAGRVPDGSLAFLPAA